MPTAKGWKEIIEDAKFPDETKLTLAEGVEVTLGEIRNSSKSEQSKMAQELAALQKEKETLSQAQLNLASTYSKLLEQGLIDANGNMLQPNSRVLTKTESGEPDYETDTYVGPFYKQFKTLEKSFQDQLRLAQMLQRQLQNNASLYENDRLYSQFSQFSDWPESVSFDQALKQAVDTNTKDKFGRLDLRGLHEKVTEPIRRKAEIAEAEKRAYDKAKQDVMVSSVPRPGTMGTRPGQKPKFTKISDAVEAARQDPEIVTGLQNLAKELA